MLDEEGYAEFKENNLFEPCLTEVHRECWFEFNNRYFGCLRQMDSKNMRITLESRINKEPLVNILISSFLGKIEREALENLKSDSKEILRDFEKLILWVGKFTLGTIQSPEYWKMRQLSDILEKDLIKVGLK